MTSVITSLFKMIKRGKLGRNKGLYTGFERLDKYTYGIQRGYFSTYGGDSGSGKSTLAIYTHIYRPLKDAQANVHVLYYSFEMSGEVIYAKLLSLYILETYQREISYKDILSLVNVISDEDYELIKLCQGFLTNISKRLTIIDKSVNADGLYATCMDWISRHGEFHKIEEHKEVFIPKDPEQYLIVVVDHIRLLRSGIEGIKIQIDKACDYLVYLRNKCNLTICVVQQLNRGFKNIDRRTKNDGQYALIQTDDFADSSAPVQSSEIVLAIFHPFREKLKTCEGYDIVELRDAIRIIQILKSRFGESDKSIGVSFWGSCGFWKELPFAKDIKNYEPFKWLFGKPAATAEIVESEIIEEKEDIDVDYKITNFTF